MGTTHTQSAGDVLPANENTDDSSGFVFDEEPTIIRLGEPLTFEHRTVRTLLGFERRRLRLQESDAEAEAQELRLKAKRLDQEAACFVAQQAEVIASRYVREALMMRLGGLAEALIPALVARLIGTADKTKAEEDAFAAAMADLAREFPDLKDTLEGRERTRREAESRASVG